MDQAGRITIGKSPSTPEDFARGFFNALQVAAERLGLSLGGLLAETALLFHGTTVGTNAIINLQGARTGLITTRGHADALLIMRAAGRSAGLPLSQLLRISRHRKPAPIVPRALIHEVSERIDWKGAVVLELNAAEAHDAIGGCWRPAPRPSRSRSSGALSIPRTSCASNSSCASAPPGSS